MARRPASAARLSIVGVLGGFLLAASGTLYAQTAPAPAVTVFAAASLKNALDEIATAYEASAPGRIIRSYAASSALARQIEYGAPADIFVSADQDWMDHLAAKKLIAPETRLDLLGNHLVIVAPQSSTLSLTLENPANLIAALAGGRLAVADVASVPAGKYAKAALQQRGLWTSVERSLAPAENVRAVLAYVARGEAPLGIVYATDAAAEPEVKIVARFPSGSHPPIVYPAAITAASASPAEARKVLQFLRSKEAREIFMKQGFTVLP